MNKKNRILLLSCVALLSQLNLFSQFVPRNVEKAFEIDSIAYDSTTVMAYYPVLDTLYDISGFLNGELLFGQQYRPNHYLHEIYYDTKDISLDIKFDPSGFFIRKLCVRTPEDTSGSCYEISVNHEIEASFNSFYEEDGIKTRYRFGKKYNETEYKDGRANGFFKSFDKDGNLITLIEMRNDSLNGIFLEYGRNGKVTTLGKTRNNEFDGVLVRYNEDGSVREIEHWEDGEKRE